jgi:hypothetical protein
MCAATKIARWTEEGIKSTRIQNVRAHCSVKRGKTRRERGGNADCIMCNRLLITSSAHKVPSHERAFVNKNARRSIKSRTRGQQNSENATIRQIEKMFQIASLTQAGSYQFKAGRFYARIRLTSHLALTFCVDACHTWYLHCLFLSTQSASQNLREMIRWQGCRKC